MRLIIHDLLLNDKINLDVKADDIIINTNEKIAHCLGCFKCWFVSPSKCVIKDSICNLSQVLGKCKEIIIISKNNYGGYSSQVKKVLDRTIGISLPFFTYRGRKIHHILRYKNSPILKVYIYGEITNFEKEIIEELVRVNGINLGVTSSSLTIINNVYELKEVLL